MTAYLVNYDLIAPNKDYSRLYEHLKTYNGYCHPLDSLWIVCSSATAAQVRDEILKYIDSDDKLLVLKSGIEAGWYNLNSSNEWLQKHL